LKDYHEIGHVEQQHEIKSGKHPETWEGWGWIKQTSRAKTNMSIKD
jgi:hypothetical protein